MFRSCCCRVSPVCWSDRYWSFESWQMRWRSDLRVLLLPPSLLHATVQPPNYNIAWRCCFGTSVIEIVFGLASIQLYTLAVCHVSQSVAWQKFHFCWGLWLSYDWDQSTSVPRRPQESQRCYRSGGVPISLSQWDSRSSQDKKCRY